MASQTRTRDGAQNQHYVPKFILRNFLSNNDKEQVTVFDKKTSKSFTPNIAGIMAERRFHDFQISDDYIASFEAGACNLEDQILPVYRRVLADRRLPDDVEERAHLAMLVAFQFLRTRRQRDRFAEMEVLLGAKLEKMGTGIERLEGYEPMTEDRLKQQHAQFIVKAIAGFTALIADKHMMLIAAATGRDFYIGDNPVVLHNSQPSHPLYGNIGLGVKGIEVYLPLSHDLLLACYCPTIIDGATQRLDDAVESARQALFPLVVAKQISAAQMKAKIDEIERIGSRVRAWKKRLVDGAVDQSLGDNMDFYNSLQMSQARQFVISKAGDFDLAKRFMKDFPGHRPDNIGVN